MRTANTHRNMARCAATATLACVLGLGLAAPAYADTASDLAAGGAAAKGDIEHALLFCGAYAYRAQKIETVKEVIASLMNPCV